MWPLLCGIVLSLGLALVAWLRARAPEGTYYEREVYGMTPSAHRRYGVLFALLAAFFLVDLILRTRVPMAAAAGAVELAALAMLVLAAILYGSTFLRGASGEDE